MMHVFSCNSNFSPLATLANTLMSHKDMHIVYCHCFAEFFFLGVFLDKKVQNETTMLLANISHSSLAKLLSFLVTSSLTNKRHYVFNCKDSWKSPVSDEVKVSIRFSVTSSPQKIWTYWWSVSFLTLEIQMSAMASRKPVTIRCCASFFTTRYKKCTIVRTFSTKK